MANSKQRVAAISIAASAGMAALKFGVGIAIGSLALISDALHSLVDLCATIVTWIVVQFSDRPADDEHHYGHGKIESLSALGMIALLYVLAGGIVVEDKLTLQTDPVQWVNQSSGTIKDIRKIEARSGGISRCRMRSRPRERNGCPFCSA